MGVPKDITGTEWDKSAIRSRTKQIIPDPRPKLHRLDKGLMPKRGDGSVGGMLPRFATAEAMQVGIDGYFAMIDINREHPTMAGLALALGFKSTRALLNYMKKGEDFDDAIETARTRIEDYKNQLLLTKDKQVQGVMFDLKNHHGYTDRYESTTKHEVGDTLAQLIQSLQGNVLRPVIDHDAQEAEFEPVEAAPRRSLAALQAAADSEDADFEEVPATKLQGLEGLI